MLLRHVTCACNSAIQSQEIGGTEGTIAMSDTVDLDREILEVVQAEWRKNSSPLLLSALGYRISDAAKAVLRASNIPLTRYVQSHMKSELRLVSRAVEGLAAAPRHETANFTDEQLADLYTKSPPRERMPRYRPSVWYAFRIPIPSARRRFLILQEDGQTICKDLPPEAEPPMGAIEIAEADLASPENADELPSPEAVSNAIEAWRTKQDLDRSKLLLPSGVGSAGTLSPANTQNANRLLPESARRPTLADLAFGLSVFTSEELARVQIPADVLANLLKRTRER